MAVPRTVHQSVRLDDGRVLVSGGSAAYPWGESVLDSVEIFDPSTGAWQTVAPMRQRRFNHGLSLLDDGRVFVTGGNARENSPTAHAEIYDVVTDSWTVVESMPTPRFNPSTGQWQDAGPLEKRRNGHRSLLLADGRVLICGGFSGRAYLRSCEIYSP